MAAATKPSPGDATQGSSSAGNENAKSDGQNGGGLIQDASGQDAGGLMQLTAYGS